MIRNFPDHLAADTAAKRRLRSASARFHPAHLVHARPETRGAENKCRGNPARCCAAPHTVTEAHGAENACRGNPASGQPAPHSHALLVPHGVENVCQKNHTRCHGAPHG